VQYPYQFDVGGRPEGGAAMQDRMGVAPWPQIGGRVRAG